MCAFRDARVEGVAVTLAKSGGPESGAGRKGAGGLVVVVVVVVVVSARVCELLVASYCRAVLLWIAVTMRASSFFGRKNACVGQRV
jgi:hypothetical protein